MNAAEGAPLPSFDEQKSELTNGSHNVPRSIGGAIGGAGHDFCQVLVGVEGFEPATPSSRTRCSTRLSHTPTDKPAYTIVTLARQAGQLRDPAPARSRSSMIPKSLPSEVEPRVDTGFGRDHAPITVRKPRCRCAEVKRAAGKKSDYTVWDDTTKGFGLRLRNGTYTWIFQYKFGADHWRIKLGTFPPLTCDEARKRAEAARGQVADAKLGRGLHPGLEREKHKHESRPKPKPQNALATFIPTYLDARRDALKGSTYTAQVRYFNEHLADLHGMPLSSITRADVATILTTIAKDRGPVAANRGRAVLSKFFRWAIGEGLCDANPVVGTNVRDENDPRERSLSDT